MENSSSYFFYTFLPSVTQDPKDDKEIYLFVIAYEYSKRFVQPVMQLAVQVSTLDNGL